MRTQYTVRLCALTRCAASVLLIFVLSACGSRQLSTAEGSGQAKNVTATAYAQIGKNYRMGGDSPQKGFDCSGLIWWAYRQHGVAVPRITKDQATAGAQVAPSQLVVGDILVFRTRTGPYGLHTGLYSGKGQFIHSPRKGQKVREEQLADDQWKNTLIAVRRVLP